MTSAGEHERHADDAGAYLLGALPELEARAFERHFMACAECRDELERLRPAAELLPRSAEQFAPPPALRRSLMRAVATEGSEGAGRRAPIAAARRWRRPRLGLGWPRLAWGAAALVIAGGLLGLAIGRSTTGGSSQRVVAAATTVHGSTARLVVRDGGATLRVTGMPVLNGGRVYEVWLEHGGTVRPAGALFEVRGDGSGAAAIPRAVRAGDRVLVTRERAGGTARPTEAPIVSATA